MSSLIRGAVVVVFVPIAVACGNGNDGDGGFSTGLTGANSGLDTGDDSVTGSASGTDGGGSSGAGTSGVSTSGGSTDSGGTSGGTTGPGSGSDSDTGPDTGGQADCPLNSGYPCSCTKTCDDGSACMFLDAVTGSEGICAESCTDVATACSGTDYSGNYDCSISDAGGGYACALICSVDDHCPPDQACTNIGGSISLCYPGTRTIDWPKASDFSPPSGSTGGSGGPTGSGSTTFDGITYGYNVPQCAVDGGPMAVVYTFHGTGASGAGNVNQLWADVPNKHCFALFGMNSTVPNQQGWYLGGSPPDYSQNSDVAAFNKLVAHLDGLYDIDNTRRYMAGHSAGAKFTLWYSTRVKSSFFFSGAFSYAGAADFAFQAPYVWPPSPEARDFPFYVAHGGQDKEIPFWLGSKSADDLEYAGYNVERDFDPNRPHWGDFTPPEPAYEWMYAHSPAEVPPFATEPSSPTAIIVADDTPVPAVVSDAGMQIQPVTGYRAQG